MSDSAKTLLVIGSGLAGAMTTLSLANSIGRERRLVYLRLSEAPESDAFYGSVTAPTAYDFLRSLGLEEPTLFMRSSTSFSLGTKYANWGGLQPWIQCHQQPFPLLLGVPMRHHLTRQKRPLASVLVGAQTAELGRFAHPPEDPNVPLSRAEYGYQFSVTEWTALLEGSLRQQSVKMIDAEACKIARDGGKIQSIIPDNGAAISADLYIDCTGQQRRSRDAGNHALLDEKPVRFSVTRTPHQTLGAAYRQIVANDQGWTATTALQDREETFTIEGATDGESQVHLGRLSDAWVENCVSIGHAAGMLEPLTPAPMMLLQRDIERLLELIPVTDDMTAERREFNRRFANDFDHAKMFQDAFFHTEHLPTASYWQTSKAQAQDPRLTRKLQQYENRGVLVRYDLEPFNDEDWTILHAGLGRIPRQYDLQTDSIPRQESVAQLDALQRSIAAMVPKVPPHHLYVTNMKRYFEKQKYA